MQFEYHVVPPGSAFTEEDLQAIRKWLDQLPTHRWDSSSFTLFPTDEVRNRRLPGLLAAPDEPDWLHGYVVLAPQYLTLGLLQDEAILHHMYDLVRWIQKIWPGTRLEYGGVEQPVESILPEQD